MSSSLRIPSGLLPALFVLRRHLFHVAFVTFAATDFLGCPSTHLIIWTNKVFIIITNNSFFVRTSLPIFHSCGVSPLHLP